MSVLPVLAAGTNIVVAVSVLALTLIRELRSERPAWGRCVALALVSGVLFGRALLFRAGAAQPDYAYFIEIATSTLLGIAIVSTSAGARRPRDASDPSRDGVTGLYKPSAFSRLADRAVANALGDGRHATLAAIELRGSEVITDTIGLLTGDRLIRLVGSAIRANIRTHDLAARYGADEFVILFDNCAGAEAQMVCARILRAVVSLAETAGRRVSLSCSIAVAPEHGTDVSALLARANEQFIAVKSGRSIVPTVVA